MKERKHMIFVLRDSFADLLDQMEFLEIEKKKVCIVTESNVAPIYLKEVCELILIQGFQNNHIQF